MNKLAAIIVIALPASAQYGGPAILSRGDAPAAMISPQLSFRPFVEVSGVYDTGLSGVGLTPSGSLANQSSFGIQLTGGVSGAHSWRHTQIGLEYRGDVTSFQKATYYSNTAQSLMLGIKHQFTRHIYLNLRETGGMFSYGSGVLPLYQAVPFDASQSYVPTTDFFDNRTIYATSQADLIIQKSARLSFDFGADGFLNRRRSTALASVVGATARGDVQYRISRRSTIGANYTYAHYTFQHIFSSSDIHGVAGTYAVQISKNLELSGFAGVMRLENKFIQNVPVDPAVAAIIGISESPEVIYSIRYIPNISARLARTVQHGVATITAGHTVIPGNGLFLTSAMTTVGGSYTYTGLRRWSLAAMMSYQKGDSVGNVIGTYGGVDGGITISRQIARSLHAISAFSMRRYDSASFSLYNRTVYDARIGLGFTPGDIPLRIW